MTTASWNIIELGDVAEDITVGFVGTMASEYVPDGIPFLRSKNILPYRILFDDIRYIAPKFHDRLKKSALIPGDVVIVRTGKPGTTAVIPETLQVANCSDLVIVRPGPRINSRFLAYYFNTVATHHVDAHLVGAVQQHFNVESARKLRIPLPPRKEQDRIADILGALDDKIELNRRMNETLEAMARALFQSWFIDFDPVHAKAAVRRAHPDWNNAQVSRTALPNVDPATAELFPDWFEKSALGPTPAGWRSVRVPDAIDINPHRSLSKGSLAPYLEMSNMPTTSARATAWVDRNFGSGAKFINGDTLVARITPCLENGKTAFVDFLKNGQVGGGSTEYIVLRPKPPLPPPFAYFLARNEDFRQHLITNMTGTSGRQRAPADCLDSYPIVVPTEAIGRLFGQRVDSLFAMMKANDEKTAELTKTRDALLPKLLTGELSPNTLKLQEFNNA
jgi:type I restriction enzyme S subunit